MLPLKLVIQNKLHKVPADAHNYDGLRRTIEANYPKLYARAQLFVLDASSNQVLEIRNQATFQDILAQQQKLKPRSIKIFVGTFEDAQANTDLFKQTLFEPQQAAPQPKPAQQAQQPQQLQQPQQQNDGAPQLAANQERLPVDQQREFEAKVRQIMNNLIDERLKFHGLLKEPSNEIPYAYEIFDFEKNIKCNPKERVTHIIQLKNTGSQDWNPLVIRCDELLYQYTLEGVKAKSVTRCPLQFTAPKKLGEQVCLFRLYVGTQQLGEPIKLTINITQKSQVQVEQKQHPVPQVKKPDRKQPQKPNENKLETLRGIFPQHKVEDLQNFLGIYPKADMAELCELILQQQGH